MRNLLIFVVAVFTASSAGAVMISADADGYGNGDNISAAFVGITLSAVGGYTGLDGQVYAWADGLASTGANVFANNLSFQRQWYAEAADGFALRADFGQLADFVAIDIIGDDSGDYGVLYAYNLSDELIDSVLSPELSYGQVFTAEISSSAFDIAYIIAGGAGATQDSIHLDNLTANIPEPTTLLLLSLGGFMLVKKTQRPKSIARTAK